MNLFASSRERESLTMESIERSLVKDSHYFGLEYAAPYHNRLKATTSRPEPTTSLLRYPPTNGEVSKLGFADLCSSLPFDLQINYRR